MNIVLDLLVVITAALLIFGGYKRGIIKTIVELIGMAASAAVSSVGASILSVNLYETFVKNMVIDAVKSALPEITPVTRTNEISESIMANSPSYVINAFEMTGIDINSLTSKIDNADYEISVMVEGLIRPIILQVFTVIVTIVLFVVIAAIVAFVTKTVTSVAETTGLGGVNRFLGAVVGFAEAAILIMILSLIIYFMTVFLPSDFAQGLRDAIDSSIIFKVIYYNNFPEMIIRGLIQTQ